MRARRHAADAGFTLIETVIATALFLVVIGALATVTAQWLPSWNRGFARVQRTEHMALGIERIMADLAAAEFITPNANVKRPIFDGTALGLIFVRRAVGPNAQPGLEIIRLAEIAGDRGPVLARATAPFMPLDPDASAILSMKFSEPVVLVRPPFRVAFSYAGQDRAWQPNWQGKDLLPRAVQATIRNSATGQILMVSSASKVHVTAAAECANPKVKNCDDALNQANDTNAPAAPGTPQSNAAPPATAAPTSRGGM
jgi:general secretion pathway protein J